MGRNMVVVDNNTKLYFGLDRVCGGYFAELHKGGKMVKSVGYTVGVSSGKILDFMEQEHALDEAKEQTSEAFRSLILDLPC